MTRLRTSALLLASLLLQDAVQAQTPCPNAQDMTPEMLTGRWQVVIQSHPNEHWALALHAHPEHQGSLQGTLVRGAQTAQVVADWDDGEFTMEESHDGQRIAATWLGRASDGLCGRQIEGTRQQGEAGASAPQHFTMRSDRLR